MGFNKKVLSKAVSELGKAKAPAKPRDITVDPKGYWNPNNYGQPVRISGNGNPKGVPITMGTDPETGQSVPFPVWAQPNVGPGVAMQPGQDYYFPDADYVDETPLAKKGGSLKSKKYSKSMSATNKLFAKNKLFKNMKSKIFDPNAKFKSGGSKLGPINLNPNPLSHYELNYGFNLPTKQDGGENEDEYMDLTDEEIQAYRDGGYIVEELPENEIGGYVQHEIVKAQKGGTRKPLEISDPKEFAYRNKMYGDSLKLYNAYQMQDKLMGPGNTKTKSDLKWSSKELQEGRKKKSVKGLSFPIAADYQNEKEQFQNGFDGFTARPQDLKLIKYYKSLGFTDKDIMYHSSPDIVSDKIKPIGTYLDGTASSPIYKKPVQPVVLKKGNEPINTTLNNTTESISTLPLKPIQQFATPEQTVISSKPYIKPKQYSGPRYGTLAGDENLELPEGATQQEREAARRKRDADEFQRKTLEYQQQRGKTSVAQMRKQGGDIEAWEDELDEDEIAILRKGGYIVEELD